MLKHMRFTAVLLAVILCLTGCGDTAEKTTDVKRNSIIVWTWDESFNVKAVKMAAGKYNLTHPDTEIIVEVKENEKVMEDVKNILIARDYQRLPDIIMIEDYDAQDMLSLYADDFVDLTDKIPSDRFVEYKTEVCSRDNTLYGIPFDSGVAALFYRCDILEKAGFTEQDMQNLTWEEYIAIGKQVKEKTGTAMLTLDPTDLPLIRLMMQSEGKWYVDSDGTTVTIKDNSVLKYSLQIMRQMLEDNIGISANGWNDFISAFHKDQVATVVSGGWIISSLKENQEQSGKWRVARIPSASGKKDNAVSNVGGSAWYILKKSAMCEQATDFAVSTFGLDDELMNELVDAIGIIPTTTQMAEYDNLRKEDPFFGGTQVSDFLAEMCDEMPVINYGRKTYEIEDIIEQEFQGYLVYNDLENSLEKAQMKAEAVAKE